ncbi:hypothetical protein LOK41_19440 [Bacillus sp. TL12]|nr:hypothetical protein [Bacillus sp. TL12]
MAEKITGHPISWVINSHWHGEHIRGNQVFENCNYQFCKGMLRNKKII